MENTSQFSLEKLSNLENQNETMIEQNELIIGKFDELNSLLKGELDRQLKEREQSSEKAKSLEQEQLEKEKIEIPIQEKKVSDREQLESDRYEKLLGSVIESSKSLKELEKKSSDSKKSDELLSEIKAVNKNLNTMVLYRKQDESYQLNQLSLGTMTVVLLMGGIGAFLLFKFGSFVVSKIIKMIA